MKKKYILEKFNQDGFIVIKKILNLKQVKDLMIDLEKVKLKVEKKT